MPQKPDFLKHIDFAKAAVWTFSMLVAAVAGAFAMYQFALRDVPDIKAGVEAIRKEIRASEDRQRSELGNHITQEQASRLKMDSTMRVLQANLISIMQRVERRPLKSSEVREIISSVRDVSTTEASNLDKPVVQGEPPKMPVAIADTVPEEIRAEIPAAFAVETYNDVSKAIAAALVAKNATWELAGRGIKVKYDGGSAFFPDRTFTTPEQLQKQVELFNHLSRAVSQTIFVAPSGVKPPASMDRPMFIKPPKDFEKLPGPPVPPQPPASQPPAGGGKFEIVPR